jgi:beta-lactamase regulating signal transducer with metallopeptidase domain/multidrug resistance efflux pump
MTGLAALFTGLLPLLLDSALKGAALLLLAAMSVLILRKASAATRHLVWLFAVGALLVLPALSALLPGWAVLPRLNTAAEKNALSFSSDKLLPSPLGQTAVVDVELPVTSAARSVPVQEITPTKSFRARDWLMLTWMAGVIVLLMRLVAAQWFLGRAESRCTVVGDGPLAETKQAMLRQLNIRRSVQLLLDSQRTIPMAWGVFRPRVLLPAEAVDWDETRLRSVLLHEMAHIKRGDAVVRWLAQLSCALHWFNPLVWFAAWRLHVESERACDDLVLTNGVRASDYAKHLLHVATNLSSARMTQACGLAMACPSRLEGRLLAVLNQRANRRRVTRALAFATLTLGLCVVIPVAMLRAAPEKTSSDAVVEGRAGNQKSTNENHTITVVAAQTDSLLPGTSAAKPPPMKSADAGDNDVNRIKLLRAESEFKRATELRGQNLISETEFNKAREEVEIARAELAGRRDEVVRIKLKDAETELARVAELQKANLVSKDALDQATYKVALLRAESTGDAAEAARVRFRQAESDFKRASQLHEQKLISEADYNDARQQFEVWRAKLQQDEIDRLTTKSLADETQALLNARFESATKALRTERTKLDNGKSTFEAVYQAARRVRDAEVELSATPDGQITALTKHVALMRQFEQDAAKRIEVGALAPGDAEALRYWRLTAEIELLRAKRAATATK